MKLEDILNKRWRINNLYRIINKDGDSIPFKLNNVQNDFLSDSHNRKITLKARQLGMSTACIIDMLDDALFNHNLSCGIVSYSREHAQNIFKRIIGHALDTMHKETRKFIGIINRSATEITFSHGSILRVDTTLRGGTYQNVLVSEFGKTCARNPTKAEEVITGTLNAVPINGKIVIESTGEGNEGFFADMIQQCVIRGNANLTPLEYKLFFYNWMWEDSYSLKESIQYHTDLTDYFNKYEKENGTLISNAQRNWYALQWKLQGDKVKQEYPSTISEAFLSSSDAFYFAQGIEKAYQDNRCLHSALYDALLPVYIAMDIGVNDLTVMVFFQIAHGEIRVIDYYEDKNKGVDFYAKFLLQDKNYLYHTIFLPHDAVKRDAIIVENTYERDFKRLFSSTGTKFHVLKRIDKQLSISHAKIKLDRCVFCINKVKKLLDQLIKYRKKWNEPTGRYLDEPLHDISSNYADAYQYMCQAVSHLETVSSMQGSLAQHKVATENRYKRII